MLAVMSGFVFAALLAADAPPLPDLLSEGFAAISGQVSPVSDEPLSFVPHPLPTLVPSLEDAQFTAALEQNVSQLGSISLGLANRGGLFNGVQLPESELWALVEPENAWGTAETVQALTHAVKAVNDVYPDTPRLHIGHMSRKYGGWLRPHRSHQSGRDVDLGFYYREGSQWYVKATEENLDVQRTWALLSALMKTAQVEYVFLDRQLQPLLRAEAERVGEAQELIVQAFDGIDGQGKPVIRHRRGHDDHVHVRFFSPVAVDNAKRAQSRVGKAGVRHADLLRLLQQRERLAQSSIKGH